MGAQKETFLGWERWGSMAMNSLELQGDRQFYIMGTTKSAIDPWLPVHDPGRRKREKEKRGTYMN